MIHLLVEAGGQARSRQEVRTDPRDAELRCQQRVPLTSGSAPCLGNACLGQWFTTDSRSHYVEI